MSTGELFSIINDAKKLLLANFSNFCCPECGALINPDDKICSYCGSPTVKMVSDRLLEKVENQISATIPAIQLKEVMIELRKLIPNMKKEFNNLVKEIEETGKKMLLERVNAIWKETRKNVSDRLMQIEEDVSQLVFGMLNKVRTAPLREVRILKTSSISALNTIATESDDNWRSVIEGIPENIVASFEMSSSIRKIADFLYRAGKFEDSIKWYSRLIMSSMFPKNEPTEDTMPKYALGEYIPFGAFKLVKMDIDHDEKNEIIYIPSKETANLKITGIVVNKGGWIWPDFELNGIVIPLFTEGNVSKRLFAVWDNIDLLDARILDEEGMRTEILDINAERHSLIPAYDFIVGDVYGDHSQAIVAITVNPFGIRIFESDNDTLIEKDRLITGAVQNVILADIEGNNTSIILINKLGKVIIYDPKSRKVLRTEETIRNASQSFLFKAHLLKDKGEDIYISNGDEIYQLSIKDNKPILIRIYEEHHIIAGCLNIKNEEYLAVLQQKQKIPVISLFRVEELMGAKAVSKVGEIPLYIPNLTVLSVEPMNVNNKFSSRRNFLNYDVDNDGADELFISLNKIFMGIDFKF